MAMTVQINNISMDYTDGQMQGAKVFFNAYNEGRAFSGNGYVPVTKEEYETNFRMSDLAELVKQKMSQEFIGTTQTQETTA